MAVLVGLALTACGDPDPAGGAQPASANTTTVPSSVVAPEVTPAPDEPPPATVVEVYEEVNFYPACGNESLSNDGVVWYQVQEFEYPEVYDRAANGAREDRPDSVTANGFAPRVVPAGPGDDVGTLVVWSDGVAHFVSDSGDLTAWLVDDELTYPWEC